jgi:hypothetical protein
MLGNRGDTKRKFGNVSQSIHENLVGFIEQSGETDVGLDPFSNLMKICSKWNSALKTQEEILLLLSKKKEHDLPLMLSLLSI